MIEVEILKSRIVYLEKKLSFYLEEDILTMSVAEEETYKNKLVDTLENLIRIKEQLANLESTKDEFQKWKDEIVPFIQEKIELI